MINLAEWVKRWQGKLSDFDRGYGPQCVDLVKQWQNDNDWPIERGNAIDWAGQRFDGYKWVQNNPKDLNQFPEPGDIAVFETGIYGHIGIVVGADGRHLCVFSQCWPTPTLLDRKNRVIKTGSVASTHIFNYLSPKCLGWQQKI